MSQLGCEVLNGQITLDHCKEVHIGNKYENNGDVMIYQNITVIKEGESLESLSDQCRQIALSNQVAESVNSSKHTGGHVRDGFVCNRCVSSTVIVLIVLFITTIVVFIIIKYKKDNKSGLENVREVSTNSAELEREYPQSLKFVWRDTWGAAQPTNSRINNSLPIERIIIIHSASQGTCNMFYACKARVLSFQEIHMSVDRGYGDIGYNFMIGGDGYIYVGRGWDQVGAHSKYYNYNSLGVAFIGDFRVDELNDNMKAAVDTLLEQGVKIGKISKDYQVYGHCQVLKSFPVSPGKNVMKFIRTWSQWNNTNISQCKG